MSNGEISAWHYATRKPVRLRWEHGRIIELLPPAEPPPKSLWLAPSLVDLQINGFAGVDFQQDNLTLDQLLTATRGLRNAGCGLYLLTLVTDEWTRLTARLRHLKALRAQSPELLSSIIGWHVEGPFLSPEPGFHGAHNPQVMIDPTPEHLRELRTILGNDPLLLTLAPERNGALEAIAAAAALGITISLGHTNAATDTLRAAVKAGATGFTHLGNALPQQLDRHDNLLWRVFDTEGLTASLIPDKIHVSPALFRLVHRVLKPESIYYTTDAMAAAGAPPGRYTIGRVELEVGADQIVRQPGKSNFAGSALRPIDGVFRAAEMLNKPWQEVWDHFATLPARLMKQTNAIKPGQPANFCVLNVNAENQVEDLCVYLNGVLG
jgi:N-acetylglucosamine-6-phosphate deacetylase